MPPLTGPVVDEAGVLDAGWETRLGDLARAARAQNGGTGPQLQYLLVSTLDGEPIENFSMRVAEAWKLGTQGKDDGVLVVVAVKDRKVRIEVGGGLEGGLTDAQSGADHPQRHRPGLSRGALRRRAPRGRPASPGGAGSAAAGDVAGAAAAGGGPGRAASRCSACCSASCSARLSHPRHPHHRLHRHPCHRGRRRARPAGPPGPLGRHRLRRGRRVQRRRRRLERRRRRIQRRRRLGKLVGASHGPRSPFPEGGPGADRRGGAPGRVGQHRAGRARWWWSAPSPTRRPAGSPR